MANLVSNSSKKRLISQAPSPPHVVRGSYIPRSSKCNLPPDHLPASYPTSLVAATNLIIVNAIEKFPLQSNVVDLCKCVVAELTPLIPVSIKSGELRQNLALGMVSELIRLLVVHNCEHHSREYELKNEVRSSREWASLVRAIAESSGVVRSPIDQKAIPVQVAVPLKDEPAQSQDKRPKPAKDADSETQLREWVQKKLTNPVKYPTITPREAMVALNLGRTAVYGHPALELVSTGTRKKLFTTASVKAVLDSPPE